MAINKKLIHFKNFEKFNSLKLSANEENTKYTLGVNGEVQDGTPDILYQSVVWIKDTQQQWTHGQMYDCSPLLNSGDGNAFLADDGTYKEIEIPQTNVYTCAIDTDHHTHYNDLLEAVNRGDQIFIKTAGLTAPYVCIPMYEESTNSGSILCYPHPIALKQNSDIGFGGSIITVNSGGFCGYDSLELIIKNSGDGTRFLSDSGEYKEISIPSFEVPTKISELENDKGYLVKVVLTQAEYDALETKDPNALYVISDANETEDNNFVTEAQLESRGFLTQTDRSELKEYDDFLLGKISDLESKLTAALGRIATLESELENTLKV